MVKIKSCIMTFHALILFSLTLTLASCGGGGGGASGGGSGGAPQSQESKAFVAPIQGEKRVFTTTIANVDGAMATYNTDEVIAQVNADGSYTANWSSDGYSLDGNSYGSQSGTDTYNDVGDAISAQLHQGLSTNPCTNIYPSGGRPVAMQPGQTWDASFVSTCSGISGTATLTQTGTYFGVENVNVPAGSFLAYKFQTSQVISTSVTLNIVSWYDASATDSRLVRVRWQYLYSNEALNSQSMDHLDRQLASY